MTTDQWWADATAAALLGTGRRPPPPLPAELGVADRDGGAEERLLDAAALGGMLRRAGSVAGTYAAEAPAPPDAWPAAPDRAVHLLQLLLTQPPFGSQLATPALIRWLRVAAERERRVPATELPALLTAATKTTELQPLVAAVADARGRWLAAANPAWAWLDRPVAGPTGMPTPEEWATMPTADRVNLLYLLRRTDPATARALVESTWTTESARDRPLLLGALQVGLSPDDEELLERALDDRAGGVREAAQKLLDRLPGSARAGRMADRLRPLVRLSGLLRRSLEIDLPATPDAAAVRDGLGKKPRNWSSERGYWLAQLAGGAPLELWTEITGRSVLDTWRMLHDASQDARAGVMRAAMARHDVTWLRAMIASGGRSSVLLKHLPPAEAAELAVSHLAAVPTYDLAPTLVALAVPWSRRLAEAVLDRIAADKDQAGALAAVLPLLADRLPAEVLPRVQRWARAEGAPRALSDLAQYLSFVPAIPEAFG